MATRSWAIAAVLVMSVSLGSSTAVRADDEADDDRDEGGEVRVKLDQVPEAARKTLIKEANGAKFDSVEREVEDGKTVYEIEVVIDGQTWGIEVDESGKLLEKELEEAEDDDDADDADKGDRADR